MATKYLDSNGLLYLWGKIKSAFVGNVSYNSTTKNLVLTKNGTDSNIVTLITQEDIPEGALPSTTTPKMDGTATIGSETTFARGDHIHPTDTSRASADHSHGNITNSGTLSVTGATVTPANGDYLMLADRSNLYAIAPFAQLDGSTTTKALTQKGTWESFVPTTRTVNGHALSSDVTVTASDVGLGNVTDGAQVNVLEGVQLNGTDLTITNKKVNVPTFGERPVVGGSGSLGLVPAPTSQTLNLTQVLTDTMGWAEVNLYTEVKSSGSDTGKRAMVLHMYTPNNNATISAIMPDATTSDTGLMSASDKTKLDSITMTNGVIDASVLPSFVDDVIEAYVRSGQTELSQNWLATGSASGTVITPEAGKIYVLMNDSTSYSANSQFRWGGTAYVKLNDGGVTAITNAEIDVIVAS